MHQVHELRSKFLRLFMKLLSKHFNAIFLVHHAVDLSEIRIGTSRRACGHVDVGTSPHQVLAAVPWTILRPHFQISQMVWLSISHQKYN